MSTPSKPSFRPREALSALGALLRDPDDVQQAFRLLDALKGNTDRRIRDRMKRTPIGARLLAERARLLDTLADREALERLPEGSFGRAYLAFLDREGITAQGLVAASVDGRGRSDATEVGFVSDHLRDQHDLWHVVAGYHGDIVGEAAMLAFTLAQVPHPGVALIVAVAMLKSDREGRAFLLEAYRRGRRAAWLPAQDWRALLARPLDEVRRELGAGDPVAYEPVRTKDIEPGTLFSFRDPVVRQA